MFKIFKKVMEYGIANGRVPATTKQTVTSINQDTGEPESARVEKPTSTKCNINFPDLIHRDMKKYAESLVLHQAMDFVSDRTASEKLGYKYEQEQEWIDQEMKRKGEREEQMRDKETNDGDDGDNGDNGDDEDITNKITDDDNNNPDSPE